MDTDDGEELHLMGKNKVAKKPKTNPMIQISQREWNRTKERIKHFVMKRAFCIVIAAFYDEADIHQKEYFKSRKKMMEYIDCTVRRVNQYKGYVDEREVIKIDEIAQMVYERTGIDWRTFWTECSKKEREMTNEG